MIKNKFRLSALALAISLTSVISQAAETTLISGKTGNNILGSSFQPALSQDGNVIAFVSNAGALVNDNNSLQHVYVKNLNTNAIHRISVSSTGANANSINFNPSISADGRYVVFYSIASNLVGNDNNNASDVFLHDLQSSTTQIVSTDSHNSMANAESNDAAISADGQFVVFSSLANNLVTTDNSGKRQIYVKNLQTDVTQIVSVNNAGHAGDEDSFSPSISGDGRYIVFSSLANNFDKHSANNQYDLFLHDRNSGKTERIVFSHTGNLSNGHSDQAHISTDGNIIAYVSMANNIISDDTNNQIDVFLYDRSKGESIRIDKNSTQPDASSFSPKVSGNGRFVAFFSSATNLINNDNNGRDDMFIYDRFLNTIVLSSVSNSGTAIDRNIDRITSINHDGTRAAFSTSTSLESQDQNNQLDVYLRKLDPPVNVKPVAIITPISDQLCSNGGAYITLDASSSYDPDQEDLDFSWSGPFGILNGINAPAFIPPGSHEVSLTVKDKTGGSHVDFITVNVVDKQAPVVNADADIVLEAESTQGTQHDVGYQASDNCQISGVSINPSPATFPLGTTAVTITASDILGNIASDVTNVTVQDNTKPLITVPQDIISEATALRSVLNIGQASASDIFPVSISHNAPVDFPLGKTVITWTAIDDNNNRSEAIQTVTLVDNTAPILTIPADINTEASAINSLVELGQASATDIFPVEISNDASASFQLGETIVTWTATDTSGNQTHNIQKINIQDNTAPVLNIPTDKTVEATAVLSSINIGNASANDIFEVIISNDAPDVFPLGDNKVTWMATDSSGNQTTAIQTISVVDTTAPELIAPSDLSVEATGPTTVVALGNAKSSDLFSIKVSHNAPLAFPLGDTLVTWTATDSSGNKSTDTQKISIIDTTAPTVSAGKDLTLEATHVNGVRFTSEYNVSDICACGDLITHIEPEKTYYGLGENIITVNVTDQSGNTGKDSLKLTVIDSTKPELQAPADILIEATGLLTPIVIGQAKASDIFPVYIKHDAPQNFPLGNTVVTWKATDANGNFSTAKQNITVVDSTAPTFQLNVIDEILWPANHRMKHALTIDNVFDLVDGNPLVDIQISSNGDHRRHSEKSDWETKQIDGQWQVYLRAEKITPAKEDRIYSVLVTVTDFSGNTAQDETEIIVPRHRKSRDAEKHASRYSKKERGASNHSDGKHAKGHEQKQGKQKPESKQDRD